VTVEEPCLVKLPPGCLDHQRIKTARELREETRKLEREVSELRGEVNVLRGMRSKLWTPNN